jgi:tetratricopeptide (TPR) repeat protein
MFARKTSLARVVAVLAAMAVAPAVSPAIAAGGDSGGGGGGGGGGSAEIQCREGWVYDEQQKICVEEQAGLLDDAQLYERGRALALAGDYERALSRLEAIENKHDAMVLTMIGYSKRKLGAVEEGIAYYHQALAIEPDNINTHEYLGEGYLSAGRIDLAEAELDTLQRLCGVGCEQYQDLARAIAGDPAWN